MNLSSAATAAGMRRKFRMFDRMIADRVIRTSGPRPIQLGCPARMMLPNPFDCGIGIVDTLGNYRRAPAGSPGNSVAGVP